MRLDCRGEFCLRGTGGGELLTSNFRKVFTDMVLGI